MADRPILFSAPMVRAILAGTKTQTRRVLKPQPFIDGVGNFCATGKSGKVWNWGQHIDGTPCTRNFAAKHLFRVGDRLWVRETIDMGHTGYVICTCTYQADGTPVDLRPAPFWAGDQTRKLIPSIHMPRWASRLTLTVTDVRVERLQDISETDAKAEGAMLEYGEGANICHRRAFELVWKHINGDGAWAANPWVSAYTFTVEHRNIDAGRAHG